jgi:NADH-quinone oxidoreductase subunit D
VKNIGIITPEDALAWGITGPMARASGVNHDLRKAMPYSGYDEYEFDVPTHTDGDTYARYLVRIEEMHQSVRIIQQALDRLPYGPVQSNNRKFVPPPRSELGTSMEAVIHHFKYWTEGFPAPKGSVYVAVESPRGELGVLLEGDGGPKPYRVHFRTPSFTNLQILPILAKGHLVADLVALIGTVDIVLGDIDR